MEELLNTWKIRMRNARISAGKTNNPNQRIKKMHEFLTLRDCIKELSELKKQKLESSSIRLLILAFVIGRLFKKL